VTVQHAEKATRRAEISDLAKIQVCIDGGPLLGPAIKPVNSGVAGCFVLGANRAWI
jgi:hypothetical protein